MNEPKSRAQVTCIVAKITQELVANAEPTHDNHGLVRQRLYLDKDLKGFGLVVGAKTKTYVAQRYVRGRSVRVKIDNHPVLTAKQARERARDVLAQMGKGVDVVAERKRTEGRSITLSDAWQLY